MIYRRALLFVLSIDLSPALWYNNSKSYCYSSVRIDEVYGFQFGVLPDQLSAMHQLQQELLDRTESRQNYDDLVEEILLLREQQEQTNMDEAAKAEHGTVYRRFATSLILCRAPSQSLMGRW